MLPNQVWKSKEARSYVLKIIGMNPNGTVKITFDFGYTPKTTHNYTVTYLNQFYEYAGYESVWINDWVHTSPVVTETPAPLGEPLGPPMSDIDKAFVELEAEKVLFGDYTGDEKVNTWKEIK